MLNIIHIAPFNKIFIFERFCFVTLDTYSIYYIHYTYCNMVLQKNSWLTFLDVLEQKPSFTECSKFGPFGADSRNMAVLAEFLQFREVQFLHLNTSNSAKQLLYLPVKKRWTKNILEKSC